VHAWLAAQPKTFFLFEVIKKLLQGWKKCTEKQGDCVEKLFYYKFSIFIEIKGVSLTQIIIIDSPTSYIQQRTKICKIYNSKNFNIQREDSCLIV
jgi:hypothetical protein